MPVTSKPIEIFYSYSHSDEDLRDELEKHLSILKRQSVITGWHDHRISAGREWEGEIDTHLNTADVILLLISSDFLASDYCYDVEMKRAMERHKAGEARVIPVILRPVDWKDALFGKLQALPKDAKPVTSWPNRDEAFLDVARGIQAAVEELAGPSADPPPSMDTAPMDQKKVPVSPPPAKPWQTVNWEMVGAIAGVISVLIAMRLVPSARSVLGTWLSRPTATPTKTPMTVLNPTSTYTPTLTPTPSPTPTLYKPPCDLKPVDFDFESKTNEGWDIRWEGSDRLGIEARPDEGHYCGSGHWSMAFRFKLREAPFDKAQIKYDASNLELTEELAGWVYLPSNAPNDLQASCFILEDNTGGRWPDKPEWPWYQTGYTLLQPSQWTLVRCLATNFVSTNYSAGHWDEPLLVGFEFTRKSKGSYEGTVYLDKVILR